MEIARPSVFFRLSVVLTTVVLWSGCGSPSAERHPALEGFLRRQEGRLGPIPGAAEEHRLQLLISEVVVDRRGSSSLRSWSYRTDAEYFYPASAIKLCAAVAALQSIEELQRSHGTGDLLHAPLEIAPLFPGDPAQTVDPSNADGQRITVGHEIRKLALVSDNQAFNRLFDLVGHEALHRSMVGLGLRATVVNHRLSESRAIPHPLSSAAVTLRPLGFGAVEMPARDSDLVLTNRARKLQVGNGFMRGETTVMEPIDFSHRNGISIRDLQQLLVKVIRPDIELGTPPIGLTENHREFLVRALTEFPRESLNPVYAASHYPDDFSKFLLPGIRRVFPSDDPANRVQVTGKIGQAYGFTVENSFVRNPANGRAVFVTAAIYTNRDGILNDDRYEYDSVAVPFLADLGEFVARRWLK